MVEILLLDYFKNPLNIVIFEKNQPFSEVCLKRVENLNDVKTEVVYLVSVYFYINLGIILVPGIPFHYFFLDFIEVDEAGVSDNDLDWKI